MKVRCLGQMFVDNPKVNKSGDNNLSAISAISVKHQLSANLVHNYLPGINTVCSTALRRNDLMPLERLSSRAIFRYGSLPSIELLGTRMSFGSPSQSCESM